MKDGSLAVSSKKKAHFEGSEKLVRVFAPLADINLFQETCEECVSCSCALLTCEHMYKSGMTLVNRDQMDLIVDEPLTHDS